MKKINYVKVGFTINPKIRCDKCKYQTKGEKAYLTIKYKNPQVSWQNSLIRLCYDCFYSIDKDWKEKLGNKSWEEYLKKNVIRKLKRR